MGISEFRVKKESTCVCGLGVAIVLFLVANIPLVLVGAPQLFSEDLFGFYPSE